MGGINIKQLAHELNLSAATVSRALRDSYEISSETKARVLAMAQKLNYGNGFAFLPAQAAGKSSRNSTLNRV